MTVRKINRGIEVRTKGKSMGRERSGAALVFLVGRIALMLAGFAVMGLGIDVVVKANLGNSPISACPYVASLAFRNMSFGTLMLVWQCLLVMVQVLLLRRDFRLLDLLQIPVSVFFGLCIDLFNGMLDGMQPQSYALSWLWLIVGMAVLALGVTMTVVSGTVMNCGEAVVQAVVRKTGARFGTMKVVFDVTCAVCAALLSFVLLGRLEGVREGTVVCALFTGMIVNCYMAVYGKMRAIRKKSSAPDSKRAANKKQPALDQPTSETAPQRS